MNIRQELIGFILAHIVRFKVDSFLDIEQFNSDVTFASPALTESETLEIQAGAVGISFKILTDESLTEIVRQINERNAGYLRTR